ncbi:MAG: hypothetical protein ABJA81_04265, partial [Nocardioidaceae bacterium]
LGISRTRLVISSQRTAISWVSGLFACGTVASVWWILSAGTNRPQLELGLSNPVGNSFKQIPLWIFQGIAAFPTRTEPAPTPVYVAGLLLMIGFCALGWRAAGTRLRRVLALTLGLSVAVPLVSTMAVYTRDGAVWQGRYGLPLVIGMLLLISVALEDSQHEWRFQRVGLVVALMAFTTAQTVSVVSVLHKEQLHSPLAGTSHWMVPQPWLVAVLATAGCALWGLSVMSRRDPSPPTRDDEQSLARSRPTPSRV